MGKLSIRFQRHRRSRWVVVACALWGSFFFSCSTTKGFDRADAPSRNISEYAHLDAPGRGQRILVIAPHIDDEVLGAGGFVADAIEAGAEVFIVYLTGGDYSRVAVLANRTTFFSTAGLNRKAHTRMAEARRAAVRLGLEPSHLLFLGYPDRGLAEMLRHPKRTVRSASTGKDSVPYAQAVSPGAAYRLDNLYADLESILQRVQPSVVIGPIEEDHHPDHRAAAEMLGEVLDRKRERTVRIGYLIHAWRQPGCDDLMPPSGLRDANWVIYPLSDSARHTKKQALSEFKTQQRSPYLIALFRSLDKNNELFLRYQ